MTTPFLFFSLNNWGLLNSPIRRHVDDYPISSFRIPYSTKGNKYVTTKVSASNIGIGNTYAWKWMEH